MKLIDGYRLTRTKTKTHRLRTTIAVGISALLFGVLFAAALVGQGLIQAGGSVSDTGFNGRFLTTVSPTGVPDTGMQDGGNIEKAMDKELEEKGIIATQAIKLSSAYQTELNRRLRHRAAVQNLEAIPTADNQIRQLGNPTAIYHLSATALGERATPYPGSEKDELIEKLKTEESRGQIPPKGEAITRQSEELQFHKVERGFLDSQVQSGQTLDWQPGEPYPIIVSYNYLEKIANRSLANLSIAERNQGYRELIQEYSGHELTYCYRNEVARQHLASAISYNHRATTDTDPATTPINIPACSTIDESLLEQLGLLDSPASTDDTLFPQPPAPTAETKPVRFKIAGFVPVQQSQPGSEIVDRLLYEIGAIPTEGGDFMAIVPSEIMQADPTLRSVDAEAAYTNYPVRYFAEFANREDQQTFIAQGCKGDECAGAKPYVASFGNVHVALEGVLRSIQTFALIAAAAISAMAIVLTIFVVGKAIADSTKEIAVFRSVGARRRDIAQIYYGYGLLLAGVSVLIAFGAGLFIAFLISGIYANDIAQALIQATGAYTGDLRVVLVGFNGSWLAAIAALLIIASVVGVTLPVMTNIRRKLIEVLREE